MIRQYEIVPVTVANARLTEDGYTLPYQRWVRPSDHGDRKMGYVLYYRTESHDGHWYRTKTQARLARQELIRERLHNIMKGD